MQQTTVLKTSTPHFERIKKLVHRTAGLRLAGSGTIESPEHWAVLTEHNGQIVAGQGFKTLPEAEAYFEQYTKPIINQ